MAPTKTKRIRNQTTKNQQPLAGEDLSNEAITSAINLVCGDSKEKAILEKKKEFQETLETTVNGWRNDYKNNFTKETMVAAGMDLYLLLAK